MTVLSATVYALRSSLVSSGLARGGWGAPFRLTTSDRSPCGHVQSLGVSHPSPGNHCVSWTDHGPPVKSRPGRLFILGGHRFIKHSNNSLPVRSSETECRCPAAGPQVSVLYHLATPLGSLALERCPRDRVPLRLTA
ncbi:hypothetical protein NDU88_000042 [Pleurodeles waltl]|uniref:Secreted protein n=1 Tax=Pleurodeles waltl TaxID=8319 RepID=A0AAV7UNV2_PLEWA|nr:hypothetical protein NDU88_000042 [Pleurodeles waltl]